MSFPKTHCRICDAIIPEDSMGHCYERRQDYTIEFQPAEMGLRKGKEMTLLKTISKCIGHDWVCNSCWKKGKRLEAEGG